MPLVKRFVARDRSDEMTEIVDCIQPIQYSHDLLQQRQFKPIGCDSDGDAVHLPLYRNPVPPGCLDASCATNFLASDIALVFTETVHDTLCV
ncbi:hypothetical protein AVEN_235548-1 [Araneus ventricosus]|uniref:Uncharacterized protein n=1 Tax=Araneus ventricosus TaxID=182803 RepID=A0A4Y2LFA4_ARAVE|nr:hypothetical protein AVEN_235548-1 [Araneus ventricosus]